MSTLKERLDRMKQGFVEKAPPEAQEIMARATEALRASDILSRLPAPGSELPAFALADTEGRVLRSEDMLARGTLILTFYRGLW